MKEKNERIEKKRKLEENDSIPDIVCLIEKTHISYGLNASSPDGRKKER